MFQFLKKNNSNQQLRFITLIDIFYEKKITLNDYHSKIDLKNLGSSKKHSEIFKRTISRLHEMTQNYLDFINNGCIYLYSS